MSTRRNKNIDLVCILGPTASGKTSIAAHLAYRLNSGVISADSRQVYKNMDIGTGKDLADYIVNGQQVPYYLIDIREAGEKYNVFEYQRDFYKIYHELKSNGKLPILCGGSGLYIEAVLKGYELIEVPINEALRKQLEGKSLEELTHILSNYKKLHNKTDVDTVKRAIRAIEIADYQQKHHSETPTDKPEINSLIVGIAYEREEQKRRITERLKQRLSNGLIDEVRKLLKQGLNEEDLLYYGLEYKYVTQYVTEKISYDEMFEKLNIAIHQFAKRQMTWFRRMEKNGFKIYWIDGNINLNDKIDKIMQLLTT